MSGTTIEKDQIDGARILILRSALKLEVKGFKASRGVNAFKMVKEEFGFKGSKQKVLDQLNKWITDNNILPEEK